MSEQGIFSEKHEGADVRITTSRAVIGGTTYAVKNITSVGMRIIPAQRAGGVLVALLGVLLAVMSGVSAADGMTFNPVVLAGVAIALAGGALAAVQKPRYAVRITTAGGEQDALVSRDSSWILRVSDALNDAIAGK